MAANLPPGIDLAGSPNWAGLVQTWWKVSNEPPSRGAMQSWFEDAAVRWIGTLVAALVKLQASFGKLLGEAADRAEDKSGPIIADMLAVGLSNLFNVPVSGGEIGTRHNPAGRDSLGDRMAQAVFSALLGSFAGAGAILPEHGKTNAEHVLGYNLRLALKGWIDKNFIVGFLSGWLPNYAGLDDEVAHVLGLSRMSSRAIGPVIRSLVTIPFQRSLNLQYRPAIFTEGQALHALNAEQIAESDYFEILGQLGWSRERAAVLRVANAKQVGVSDLQRWRELDLIDEAELERLLTRYGYDPDTSRILARSVQEDRVRSGRNSIVSTAVDLYADRALSEGELRALLQEAGYSDLETRTYMQLADLRRSRPRELERSTVEQAYVEGIITLGRLHDFYTHAGYNLEDAILLEQLATARRVKAARRAST